MKVLIVDDEGLARARLRTLLEEIGQIDVAGEASSGLQAIELAQDLAPDVVLLDIRMPGMDGLETARHLSLLGTPPAVIFSTAYDEYAIDAFDAQAIGYLLKPVRLDRLRTALQAAQKLTRPQLMGLGQRAAASDQNAAAEHATKERTVSEPPAARKHLAVRLRDRLKLISMSDVRYFLADQKYVKIKHAQGEDLIEESLKSLEEEFNERFARVHRNALVAVDMIESVQRSADGQLEVIVKGGGDRLTVSRRLAAELLRRLRG